MKQPVVTPSLLAVAVVDIESTALKIREFSSDMGIQNKDYLGNLKFTEFKLSSVMLRNQYFRMARK